MKRLKRGGILLLALCVVMSCMSLPARATEGNEAESEITDVIEDEAMDTSEEKSEEESEVESEVESEEENSETEEEVSEETGDEVIQEESEEEIISDSDEEEEILTGNEILWTEPRTLSGNLTVNGNLYIDTTVKLNGYILTVNGDVIASGCVYTGDYGKLVVKGNYTQKSGGYHALDLDGTSGTIDVSGDLRIYGLDNNGNVVLGNANIYTRGSSVLNIGGDFIVNTSSTLVCYEGGTINLNGDLNILTDNPLYYTTINFNGTKQQLINISSGTRLGKISGTNDNIKVATNFNGVLLRNYNLVFDNTLNINKELKANGYYLTLNGDVIAEDCVYSGDYGKIIVKGNYTQKAGGYHALDLDGTSGTIDVEGDLRIYGLDKAGNIVKGDANIYTRGSSVLNIGGDFITNTDSTLVCYGGGTINLKGDLKLLTNSPFWNTTINFNGTKQQFIDIQSNTRLGKLSGTNEDIKVAKNFNGSLMKDITVKSDNSVHINKELEVNGHKFTVLTSVIAEDKVHSGDYGKIIVNGSYTQKAGGYKALDLSGTSGTIEVAEDLRIHGLDANENVVTGDANIYTCSSSILNIGRDFVMNTSDNISFYEGGTINIKGNISQPEGGSCWNRVIVNLIGNADENHKQIITIPKDEKIKKISLKSCGDYYVIPEGCYEKLEKPEHKYDSGVVTKPTTKTTDGEKTFTCTVCGHEKVEKIPKVEEVFSDVQENKWYTPAVQYVYENGIMVGGNNKFDISGKLTREQLVQMLYSIEGKPRVNINNPFGDVKEGAWYYNAVLWAKQSKVASGSGSNFGVGKKITRQDLAVMLYAYADYKGFDKTTDNSAISGFADANKVSSYAKNAMNWAVTQGLISGKGGNRLDPTGNATRAECALIIMNLLEKN